MSACEKCWRDSRQDENYHAVLASRAANPCTPEEQAGPDATLCEHCNRRSRHQITNECMNPMCKGGNVMTTTRMERICTPCTENQHDKCVDNTERTFTPVDRPECDCRCPPMKLPS